MSGLRIGTAGWAIPRASAECFPAEGSTLQRYAARFDAAEINSSFHRPHRSATWERWRDSVPPAFRFAVKLPKAITHERRLVDCDALLQRLAEETALLGGRRGPVLVQLPPSLAFDAQVARRFFAAARAVLTPLVCEPRHPSWFTPEAEAQMREAEVARVAADPARVDEAALPGGWEGLVYARLHGSPRIYRSAYDDAALRQWADRLRPFARAGVETWIVFDNTATGAAVADALRMQQLLAA